MLLDHVGEVFLPNMIVFYIVGRIALPLFAWGIVNGYKKTINLKMYALRILILAIVSQYPYLLLFKNEYFNICFLDFFCFHYPFFMIYLLKYKLSIDEKL